MPRRPVLIITAALLTLAAVYIARRMNPAQPTIAGRLTQLGPAARQRWAPFFDQAHTTYPPRRLTLLGLKSERRLEIYADDLFIRAIPILAASGSTGPKLREGDRQVPEGFYTIALLNPASRYHLSLRIDYPNGDDRRIAAAEGRTNLGGDIMIHGGAESVGCLALGDEAAEDLFVLAADAGLPNIRVLLCPVDFRVSDLPDTPRPPWVNDRYAALREALRPLRKM